MQYFARSSFLGGFFRPKMSSWRRLFAFTWLLEPSARSRSATSSLRLALNRSAYTRKRTSSAGGSPPTVFTLLTRRRERDAVLLDQQVLGKQPSVRNNQHQQTKHVLFEREKDRKGQPETTMSYLSLSTKSTSGVAIESPTSLGKPAERRKQ